MFFNLCSESSLFFLLTRQYTFPSVFDKYSSNILTDEQIEEAQTKIDMVNSVLAQSYKLKVTNNNLENPNFSSKLFIISSIILGTLVTISSFIWGIL